MKLFHLLLFIIIGLIISSCTTSQQTTQLSPELPIEGASAHWISADRLIWDPGVDADSYELRYSLNADLSIQRFGSPSGQSLTLSEDGMLTAYQADKFRHISDRAVFSVNGERSLYQEALKGQVLAVAYDLNGIPINVTRVQNHGVIDDLYTYDGQLGPVYTDNVITLKIWARTAQNVTLSIFDNSKNEIDTIDPTEYQSQNGVWVFEGSDEWDRHFYRLHVTVVHHENKEISTFEVTDPYSVSLSTDSHYSQFVNLKD